MAKTDTGGRSILQTWSDEGDDEGLGVWGRGGKGRGARVEGRCPGADPEQWAGEEVLPHSVSCFCPFSWCTALFSWSPVHEPLSGSEVD